MATTDSINDYLAHLLAQANRRLNRQLNEKGVPVDQWRVLRVLHESDGLMMRELADSVSLNRPTMTKVVDKMVADALAYRIPDPRDRRKVRIFLSDQGKALFRQQDQHVSMHQKLVEKGYGVEETKQLKEMLEKFLNRVS
jgi:MarR family transcriptional regulator, organic hydroperoxide resistance regulator